ncbi:MAG: deoxyhypusine synthase family protein [Acidobacteria bacterium]|nr:deoxyhypusine synthase family protein [Acidobacteriota bacterium]
MKLPYEEFDLSSVTTYPLKSRKSKSRADDFARVYDKGSGVAGLIGSLPRMLAAADLTNVVRALLDVHARGGAIIWGLGAHVIKTGLSPVIVDLMERGFMSAIAMTGAGVIHDFEVALVGETSEEVEESLGPGRFGMAAETGTLLNRAINEGVARGWGIGQAVGAFLESSHPRYERASIAAAATRLQIPLTVHVAIGTDVIHMHPDASGARLGEGSLRDFRFFVSNVAKLDDGVYMNCGSAVVLPEVFLKAVALARNRSIALANLTTVNLDFARLYRPLTNVVSRPTAGSGRGYSIVGHHELMLPLIAAALIEMSL